MKVEFAPEFEKSLRKLILAERLAPINPKEWYRKTKYFIQRGRRGYSNQDLWGAYYHIGNTVIAFAEFQKKHGAGYPMGLKSMKEWNKILDEIVWYMHEVMENTDTPIEVLSSKKYQDRCKKANALFAKYWQNMWD